MNADNFKHSLNWNVKLLKTKVSQHAIFGLIVAFVIITIATLLGAFAYDGRIDLESLIYVQKHNSAIWVLDLTPFLFAFWGQYVSSIICYQAGAMVVDQTSELRQHTTHLESKMSHEATHDSLTNLPNRVLFIDRLSQALTNARNHKTQLAVLIININRFKEINDALGHHNGDRLLKQIAARLQGSVLEPNTLARLSSDEFAILIPQIQQTTDAKTFAVTVQKALSMVFTLDEINLDISAATGVATFPEHGSDPDTLIQRAIAAVHGAKKNNATYMVYSSKLDKNNPQKLILMGELHRAIENDDLILHYQPKIDVKTGKPVSAEALVRWKHQDFGVVAPDQFIPLAERTGLIKSITHWVLNEALKQCAEWHKFGIQLDMSVNLSAIDILDIELPEIIAGLLAAYDLDPSWLKLELTESAIMKDQKNCLEILNRLAALGIKLSVDDFGTGYSSLAYLSKLPVSEVKIDKSFVMSMLSRHEDEVIVRAIIDLARNLGLDSVAEGVATKEIYQHLQKLNCDITQGFYMSRPIPHDVFLKWVTQNPNFNEHTPKTANNFGKKQKGDDLLGTA